MGRYKEGIWLVEDALEIFERLGDTVERARCLIALAWLLRDDKQLDAAEEAASRAIDLQEKGQQFEVCKCHLALGRICYAKGTTEKAINHFEAALGIASPFNWRNLLFWLHHALAELFINEDMFGDAQAHTERTKSHAINDPFLLAHTMVLQTWLRYKQHKFEEAKSEALCAADAFGKLGAVDDVEYTKKVFRWIDSQGHGLLGYP